jgi:hypothetical protein
LKGREGRRSRLAGMVVEVEGDKAETGGESAQEQKKEGI